MKKYGNDLVNMIEAIKLLPMRGCIDIQGQGARDFCAAFLQKKKKKKKVKYGFDFNRIVS